MSELIQQYTQQLTDDAGTTCVVCARGWPPAGRGLYTFTKPENRGRR